MKSDDLSKEELKILWEGLEFLRKSFFFLMGTKELKEIFGNLQNKIGEAYNAKLS